MKFGGGVDEEGRKIWIGFRDILHAHEFAAKEHYCRLRAGSFLIHSPAYGNPDMKDCRLRAGSFLIHFAC